MSATYEQMRQVAEFDHQNELARINELHDIAVRLSPSFRDKYDFSDPKHFEAWADLTWTGAEAMLERKIKATRDASKARQKAEEKANVVYLRELEEAKKAKVSP